MYDYGIQQKRRKYRLNKKKFTVTLLVLSSIIALIVLIVGNGSGRAANSGDMTDTNPVVPGEQSNPMEPEATPTGPCIVLDAGHGGFDPGTLGVSGTREDVLNLQITQRLKTLLEQNGVQVIMTREDENALKHTKDEDMAERARIIEQSGADLVVSIHMNWYEEPEISGPMVLYIPGSAQGRRFAEMVQDSLNAALDTDGMARSENFFVLRSGSQPSIMVECGYISNAEEEAKLKQQDYQQKVAEAICGGVLQFMEENNEEK